MQKGSPPRGRGKEAGCGPQKSHARITPAWAGKRSALVWVCAKPWDHPLVGGEKTKLILLFRFRLGSPPRWRGKAEAFVRKIAAGGITPALAGKSSGCRYALTSEWDHPRVGGEKLSCPVHGHHHMGSPPRWRGKAPQRHRGVEGGRITPALAGKRLKRSHRSGIFISGPIPFHSVLHRPAGSGGSRAGRDGSPAGQPQNAGPA